MSSREENRIPLSCPNDWFLCCVRTHRYSRLFSLCHRGEARAYKKSQPFGRAPQSMKIWMDGVVCGGNEMNIGLCSHNGWGTTNCNHNEDAGVSCLGVKITTTTTTPLPTTTTTPLPTICEYYDLF